MKAIRRQIAESDIIVIHLWVHVNKQTRNSSSKARGATDPSTRITWASSLGLEEPLLKLLTFDYYLWFDEASDRGRNEKLESISSDLAENYKICATRARESNGVLRFPID